MKGEIARVHISVSCEKKKEIEEDNENGTQQLDETAAVMC